ncbi:MAG: pilus assembly protein TadG-related protein [Victivallaceae bacterium]|nr:pilus assembly protein TadG-related protein [Victivallaceae bacterium]
MISKVKGGYKSTEQGQVLILVVIVMLILMLAILFMFDLQTVIRGKMKLETGEQAAALTAAKWQKESLNLIGELNLVKACDILLSDIPYVESNDPELSPEKIASASKCVTEMQSRISFIGPLIGLGAAQQAAKNNGMAVNQQLASEMYQYIEKLAVDPRYTPEAGVPEYIPSGQGGYHWRDPYISMLTNIMIQGMAVRPNGRFPGLEGVDPRWLTSESLYSAINNQLWCNPTLNMLVKLPDSYWSGKWWNIEFSNTRFPNESEIYTLRIQYTGAKNSREYTYDLAENEISRLASDRGMNVSDWDVLRNVTWCTYDSSWYQDSSNYNGPDTTIWNRERYLRADLKNSFLYGGPLAYAEGYQNLTMLNQYETTMARPSNVTSDQLSKAQLALRNNVIRDKGTQSVRVGNNVVEDMQPGGALAKIIGAAADAPPCDTGIILPLFTDVALVPSTIQAYRPMRGEFSLLEKFLIWLSDVDDLHNPATPPPAGTESYLAALQLIDSAPFRKSGYNNDFDHNSITGDLEYFGNRYKYNENSNPTGAGWLQEAYLLDDLDYDPDNPSDNIVEGNDGWNVTYSYHGKMIIRDRNGNIITNNQAVCNWMPGGPGPGPPPGTRVGPPRL